MYQSTDYLNYISDTEMVNYFRAGIVFTNVIHYYSHIAIRHVTD